MGGYDAFSSRLGNRAHNARGGLSTPPTPLIHASERSHLPMQRLLRLTVVVSALASLIVLPSLPAKGDLRIQLAYTPPADAPQQTDLQVNTTVNCATCTTVALQVHYINESGAWDTRETRTNAGAFINSPVSVTIPGASVTYPRLTYWLEVFGYPRQCTDFSCDGHDRWPATGNANLTITGDLDADGFTCTPLPQVSVQYLLPDGTLSAVPTSQTATLYKMQLADGSLVQQVVPPTGWSPVTATDEELKNWGFDTRPTDPEMLAQWNADYANYSGSAPVGMCQSDAFAPSVGWDSGPNWSGVIATSTSATYHQKVTGIAVQPTFEYECPHKSSHAIWTGLGGNRTNRLLQAGTEVLFGDSISEAWAWWEAISENFDTRMVRFNLSTPPGHRIKSITQYFPSDKSAYMTVVDLTTGKSASTGLISGISNGSNTIPMDAFYDGRSAEAVDERADGATGAYAVDGRYYYFRRQLNSAPTHWEGVWVNGSTKIGDLNRVNMNMIRPNGNRLADPGGGVSNGGASYYDFWNACA
jgi:hypothetical protein